MNVEEYRKIVHEDIAIACQMNSSTETEEFLSYATSLLMNGEEFDDFVECHCEGGTQNTAGYYCIDGYAIDETDGSFCVFITDYHGPEAEDAIRADDVSASFNKIRRFVEKSIKSELFREIQNRSAMEFSRDLFFDNEKITRFRFFLLTDAYNRQRAKTIKDLTINDRIVELNVWDIERIFDLVSSQMQKESVEINFSDFGVDGIPCVKAVDHKNIIADIDVSPVYEKEDEESLPENIITYSSYLAVVPGEVLNKLYLDYGSKLLEGNVRSFLSAKRKVDELTAWRKMSGLPLKKFFNTSGLLYKSMELKTKLPEMSEEEQLKLLATDGMLVKRPLVIGDDFVLVGFKESEWSEKL